MTKERMVTGTLDWCNKLREKQGKDSLSQLPKGRRRDGQSCPCGKACGGYVGLLSYWLNVDDWRQGVYEDGSVPEVVTEFITKFDDGEFPEYEEEGQ